jgi:late competence protein required for DNA uptake (superfamily II DNA/RNA helicase)
MNTRLNSHPLNRVSIEEAQCSVCDNWHDHNVMILFEGSVYCKSCFIKLFQTIEEGNDYENNC